MSSSKKTGNRFSQEEAVEILAQSILLREAIDNLIKEAVECLTKVEDKKPKLEVIHGGTTQPASSRNDPGENTGKSDS